MRPICLFTDFGLTGPYVGQMKAALYRHQPMAPVIDLMADAPVFDPRAAAYFLAALLPYTPDNAVLLGVVDPGVGGARRPIIVEIDGRLLVGPDNGLFAVAMGQARHCRCWEIGWRPADLSATFHGRDLFAPVAAELAAEAGSGQFATPTALPVVGSDWPADLNQVIYVDHYGNAITGLRGHAMSPDRILRIGQNELPAARTFSEVPVGQAFWYVNSIGLVEISVNCGRASSELPVFLGDIVG